MDLCGESGVTTLKSGVGTKGIHGRLSAGPADPAGESPGFQARL